MNTSVGLPGMNLPIPVNTARPAFGGRQPATAKDSIHFGNHHDEGGAKRGNPLARWATFRGPFRSTSGEGEAAFEGNFETRGRERSGYYNPGASARSQP